MPAVSAPVTCGKVTATAVRDSGIVMPARAIGAPGVPGLRSMNELPSRNSRGRIFAVASVCSGSADFSSSIVTSALRPPR